MAKKQVGRIPKRALHYAEYLEHRLGDQLSTGWITRPDLMRIAVAAKAERNGTLNDEDPCEEDLWDQLMHTNDTLYMTNEVFGAWNVKNPVRRCAAILKAVESVNGSWGVRGDEGSITFGLSPQMALDKLDKLEGPSRLR